jgi:hypothetical protein
MVKLGSGRAAAAGPVSIIQYRKRIALRRHFGAFAAAASAAAGAVGNRDRAINNSLSTTHRISTPHMQKLQNRRPLSRVAMLFRHLTSR